MSGGIQAVTMPKFGLAMTEGAVAAWHVAEGQTITEGQEIADIETAKITNGYETPIAGVLRRKVVADGEVVPVGTLIAVVAPESVDDAEIDAFIATFQSAEPQEADGQEALAAGSAPEPERVAVAGRTVRRLRAGPSEKASASSASVLIHGFGGDLNSWMFTQPVLAEDRHCDAVDLPNHGESTKDPALASLDDLAAAMADYLDAAELERVHLVGHSLGGAIAARLAAGRPEVVASVTLIAPAGMGDTINADYVDGFIEASRRKALTPVLGLLFADPGLVTRAMVDEVVRFKRLDGVAEALKALRDACFPDGRQRIAIRSDLEALACPVHILWGEKDAILPVDQANNAPPAARVHRLPGVGHMAHMEAARETTRLIRDAMAEADRPSTDRF